MYLLGFVYMTILKESYGFGTWLIAVVNFGVTH